jgi:hypothetical protein
MNGDLRQAEHQLTTALATFRDLGDHWGQGNPCGGWVDWLTSVADTSRRCMRWMRVSS